MKKITVLAIRKNLMVGNALQENRKISIAVGKRFLLNWGSAYIGWFKLVAFPKSKIHFKDTFISPWFASILNVLSLKNHRPNEFFFKKKHCCLHFLSGITILIYIHLFKVHDFVISQLNEMRTSMSKMWETLSKKIAELEVQTCARVSYLKEHFFIVAQNENGLWLCLFVKNIVLIACNK